MTATEMPDDVLLTLYGTLVRGGPVQSGDGMTRELARGLFAAAIVDRGLLDPACTCATCAGVRADCAAYKAAYEN